MYILRITDGTTYIDLNNCDRISLVDWTPVVPGPKNSGTWSDSPLAMGRQLVDWQWENWAEVLTLRMVQNTQDKVIRLEQDLQRLLVKAHQYWTTDWQNEPVWLEVRAPCETNTRYAIVKGWRTPAGSTNPFQQPFILPEQKSIIDDFQLAIEHGPWLADEPGTGTCVQISGSDESYPFHLEFNETTSDVDCGSDASIDDLPSGGDFTIEAWIRADGWGDGLAGNFSRIATKATGLTTIGWSFYIDPTYGLSGICAYSVTDAISESGLDDFVADGEWHHVAMVWDNGTRTITLWIDGVEPSYDLQQAGAGVYASDAAVDYHIGNRQGGNRYFEGGIGWVRLSDTARYAAGFTPPSRCMLPDIDGNTLGQWIGPENNGATIDNQEGTAALDGTQTDCNFGSACEYGRTETCDDEVYIANKHNRAQLTHVFVDDGGAFGGNLIGAATPFNLLPAVPAVNDAAYFGIDTTFDDSGPFCSLVFDIGTAIVQVTTIAWEYWNGAAWSALGEQDNTNADGAGTGVAFDTTGVNSVHWSQASDWATTAVNGVTGYWVRARVTAIGGAPTAPTQDNRDIYTILWPYIEIAEDQVPGDIELALRSIVRNQSAGAINISGDNRVLFGLRSVDRGEDYTPYINIADEQNPTGISVSVAWGAETSFQTDTRAPSGRSVLWTPVVPGAQAGRARVSFDNTISYQYNGTFHVFMRVSNGTGAAGNFDLQLYISAASGPPVITNIVTNQLSAAFEFEVLDFGQVKLPGYNMPNGYIPNTLYIDVYGEAVAAAGNTLTLFDIILIPVDEWSADIVDPVTDSSVPGTSDIDQDEYLDLDNVTYPKDVLSFIRQDDDDIKTRYNRVMSIRPVLQANTTQRLWFMTHRVPSTTPTIYNAEPESGHSVVLTGNARYLYARGDR